MWKSACLTFRHHHLSGSNRISTYRPKVNVCIFCYFTSSTTSIALSFKVTSFFSLCVLFIFNSHHFRIHCVYNHIGFSNYLASLLPLLYTTYSNLSDGYPRIYIERNREFSFQLLNHRIFLFEIMHSSQWSIHVPPFPYIPQTRQLPFLTAIWYSNLLLVL